MNFPKGSIVLYMLVDYSNPIFVGLARAEEFANQINQHRQTIRVPFAVQVLQTFTALHLAHVEARALIKRYLTNIVGYNKTDYGDLDYTPFVNTGGYKLNDGKGLLCDPRYDQWRLKGAIRKSEVAKEANYRDRLPYHKGDSHPMKQEKNRLKLKGVSTGRKRYYFEDGSWTWCYSKDHPLAHKNRDNNIPNLEDLPTK